MGKVKTGNPVSSWEVDVLIGQLKKMSRNDRILVGLYFYEGLSVEEIALILNWSTEKVRVGLNRIFPRLVVKSSASSDEKDLVLELFG